MNLKTASIKLLKEIIKAKKNERICLVMDHKNDVFNAIKDVLKEKGFDFEIVKIKKNRLHSSPIPEALESFKKCKIIIAPTRYSITHSPETYYVRKRLGVRVASMPGISKNMFINALKADQKRIKEIGKKLIKKLKNKKVVNVISKNTNLLIKIEKVNFKCDDGDISYPGAVNNIPFGEVCGYEIICDGKMKIDSWRKRMKNAIIYLKNGEIVKWNKGAEKIVKYLMKAGKCGLKTIELGFGINETIKKPIGNVLNDEKIYGSVHIGFGGYGKVKCKVHEDLIILKPTVLVDGEKIIENGKIVIK